MKTFLINLSALGKARFEFNGRSNSTHQLEKISRNLYPPTLTPHTDNASFDLQAEKYLMELSSSKSYGPFIVKRSKDRKISVEDIKELKHLTFRNQFFHLIK